MPRPDIEQAAVKIIQDRLYINDAKYEMVYLYPSIQAMPNFLLKFCQETAYRPWTRWCMNCVQDVCKSISWHIGCIILVLSHPLMLCVDGGRASQTNINIELSVISVNKLEESVCSAHPNLPPAISVISNQRLSLRIRLQAIEHIL